MKIAFYKGIKSRRPVDIIICLATLSKYSHCEIVFSDGQSASSSRRDGGVRFKEIEFNDNWDIYEMNDERLPGEMSVQNYFNIRAGNRYDYLGAFGSWLHIDLARENKDYCSRICSIPLGGPKTMTPGDLFKYLKENEII